MLNTMILADNIQKYRKARGLTQNELAQSLSISPQAISKWERGGSVPDIENLCLMAERLEVSVDTLLGGSYATEKAMIAVDGGTSKTEFILFTEHGTLLHRLLLGGCNPNVIGIDGACQVLREGLDDLFKRHAFVCGVYIGASGFGTQDNARLIASQLQKAYPHIKLRCTGAAMPSAKPPYAPLYRKRTAWRRKACSPSWYKTSWVPPPGVLSTGFMGNLPLLSRILRRLSFRRTPAQTAGRNVSWRNTPVALPG